MILTFSTLEALLSFITENRLTMKIETMAAFIFGEADNVLIDEIDKCGFFKMEEDGMLKWHLYIPLEEFQKGLYLSEVKETAPKIRKKRRLQTIRALLEYPNGNPFKAVAG